MIFSEKLRLLRKKNGYTQETLAKEIGVTRQAVYKWEDGQVYPEVDKLVKLRILFQASIDNMLDDGYSVSDDGTLKTNAEVEYENEHKKKRKPRKDKGIKTGIPPMRKNGEPVIRRKKVEEPQAPVKEKTEKPAAAPAPAPSAAKRGLSQRDAASAARAAIEARRHSAARQVMVGDDTVENNILSDESSYEGQPAPAPVTSAPAPEKAEEKQPREKKKVESLYNSETMQPKPVEKAEAPAPEKKAEEKKIEEEPTKAPAEEPKKRRGFFGLFRRK